MNCAKVTILGCGNSTGVPAIGNHWGKCDPNEPKNRRARCSIAVQTDATTIIIDTGPDFSAQLTQANISCIDGVFYTHMHSDHVAGMDELRILRFRNSALIPIYLDPNTFEDLNRRFPYIFNGGDIDLYPPIVDAKVFENKDLGQVHTFQDISFIPFYQDHGTCQTVGYRFGDFAYSVDILTLDDKAIQTLKGIKTWVVDAAAYHQTGNPVHANLETIYALNDQIGAEEVILTSLSLAMDYQTLLEELPKGYSPAWDGLTLSISIV